jgi:hypothetical protein
VVGNSLEVNADKRVFINKRPTAMGARGGVQRLSVVCGGVGFSCAVNALQPGMPLFAGQWTDPSRLCVINAIRVSGIVVAASTAATLQAPFDVSAYVLRNYTMPISGSSTTSLAPFVGAQQDMRTSFGGLTPWGDLRYLSSMPGLATSMVSDIASGAGTFAGEGVSPGVYSADSKPFARVQGFINDSSTVASIVRQIFPYAPVPLYTRDDSDLHPVVLGQNEGLLLTNPLAGPAKDATATFNILVRIEYAIIPAPNPQPGSPTATY